MICYFLNGFLLIVLASCAQAPKLANDKPVFRMGSIKESNTPLVGKNFSVHAHLNWKQFAAPVKSTISEIKDHFTSRGMNYVPESKSAHLHIAVGADQYKEVYEGADLKVMRLFIFGSRQEYGKRPETMFGATAIYYISAKPSAAKIAAAYEVLLGKVKAKSFTYEDKTSTKSPGCAPIYGYLAKRNDQKQSVVTLVEPNLPFSKSKVRVGDVILAVNGKDLDSDISEDIYDTKKGARFVFLRGGRSFEKVIKPSLECKNVWEWQTRSMHQE